MVLLFKPTTQSTYPYAWSFQSVLTVPYTSEGIGTSPSHFLGRGFSALISGYDRNNSGVYIHTNDDGNAYRGGTVWSQQQRLVASSSSQTKAQAKIDQFGKWMVHDGQTLIVSAPGQGLTGTGK